MADTLVTGKAEEGRVSTARFIVADVFDGLATLDDTSVDAASVPLTEHGRRITAPERGWCQ